MDPVEKTAERQIAENPAETKLE
jgi:hypothetical protein